MPEPATTMGDLRADDPEPASKRDFLGSVTLEPGTPELRNAGDAPSDNVRRLATGEGLECGRFPEELNGAIGCLPEADEELVPRLMPMPPTRIARNITQVPRGKAFRAMYFEPAKHYGHTSSARATVSLSHYRHIECCQRRGRKKRARPIASNHESSHKMCAVMMTCFETITCEHNKIASHMCEHIKSSDLT